MRRRFRHICFNPVLGFLVVSTVRRHRPRAGRARFNPVLGFLVVSTTNIADLVGSFDLFQSRLGFSGRLDSLLRSGARFVTSSFNPVLGFLVVSTHLQLATYPVCYGFNPVLGFLVVSTYPATIRIPRTSGFQSRLGFSGRLDARRDDRSRPSASVSIPSWVFWSSRPSPPPISSEPVSSFNPVLGFLVVSTTA